MVMEQENTGSTEGTSNTGSEAATSEKSNEVMPDDPSRAENQEAEVTTAKGSQSAKSAEPPKPAYTPNYKYKAAKEEKEFDDWAKAAIKDPETEKTVREIFEKAHGLEAVKMSRDQLLQEKQMIMQDVARHTQDVNNVNQWLAKKDYDKLFSFLKVPEDDILRQAKKILDLREMPPEQRQAYEQARQNDERAMALEYQNQTLQQQHMQFAVRAREQELAWTMSRPEISQMAQAYDARLGYQGAFRQAVVERGQYHYFTTGQDIPAEQAVNEVLRQLGGPQALIAQPGPAVTPRGQQGVVTQAAKPAVITNIQGRGTSPAKKVIKNMEELKKRAKEVQAEAEN